ncbi:probable assembly chaperone of rpl4 isoform X1 [Hippoglossus hippoglossus]|uniref:probable assembly chaperone of rpl4 isoform X1 n=1 Tax=Hippoglossus hippoglossus TaxID=8267 RepID=UPI00148B7533|nr:probable assembly chaperone of rpl4 isoform X1 [Hippoglossus hippoglossus]XP_035019096.1 probable assembly chaperone of rpl4 isoform X1 [Hippoglossus stenolepis]
MGGQAKGKKKNKPKRNENRPNRDAGIVGLTPQERMKVRMHEKAKKKTAEKYPVQQLLEKTEECMDSLDFEMAGLFCQRALDVEATNLQALDMLGHICSELGDTLKAKGAFLRAVELSPDEGHSKYMYLGQIHTGQEAVDFYTKGIQVLLSALDKQAETTQAQAGATSREADEDSELPTAKDVSAAYCSIAEIYLTDLCMEEGAADKCREFVEKALQYHQDNPEALQLMASYLFSTEKNQEGREYLLKSVGLWLPAQKQSAASSSTDERMQSEIPPYESRITTAKLLIESEEYEMAVDVLEGLLEEDDEVVQVWYLSGWVCYLQLEKSKEQQEREGREVTEEETEERTALKEAARSYLTNAKKLYSKLRCDDQPILEHVEKLLGELGGEIEGEEEDPALDEDYEPCSDEEGDNADAAMEH